MRRANDGKHGEQLAGEFALHRRPSGDQLVQLLKRDKPTSIDSQGARPANRLMMSSEIQEAGARN